MTTTHKILSQEVLAETEAGTEILKADVTYHKDARVRGYYLHMHRATRRQDGTESLLLSDLLAVKRVLLEAAPRFNRARLDALVPDPAVVAAMREQVVASRTAA